MAERLGYLLPIGGQKLTLATDTEEKNKEFEKRVLMRLLGPVLTLIVLVNSLANVEEWISCDDVEANTQELIVWLTLDDKDGARLNALSGVAHVRSVFASHVHVVRTARSCSDLREANEWIKDCRHVEKDRQ